MLCLKVLRVVIAFHIRTIAVSKVIVTVSFNAETNVL
jgi:hypothetical protein